jgi:sodium/bile acid cotransporter 7
MVKQLFAFLARFGLDWFILSIIGVILLASQLPGPGIAKGPFSISSLAAIGISFIFFFYGLKLNKAKLVAGLSNWKLHILVQCVTFVVFPLLLIAFQPFFSGEDGGCFGWAAFLWLRCHLPFLPPW